MIVDVHSHLDLLEDVKSAIKGVIAIGSGLDHESNLRILELTNKFENVKACLGVYPIDALKLTDEEIDEEIYFIRENKINLFINLLICQFQSINWINPQTGFNIFKFVGQLKNP